MSEPHYGKCQDCGATVAYVAHGRWLRPHHCPHGVRCERFYNQANHHEDLLCPICTQARDARLSRSPNPAHEREESMADQDPIQLGDVARDEITGFEGVVIAETRWLHGCRRLTLQPRQMKDSKPLEPMSFDEPQCTLVSRRTVARTAPAAPPAPSQWEPVRTGGPTPEPVQHPSVSQH